MNDSYEMELRKTIMIMIDITKLEVLKTFKYIGLSSKIEEWKSVVPGTYYIFREKLYHSEVVDYVELKTDGTIGTSNLNCCGPRKWDVRVHPGKYNSSQNSFDVSGLSTMEIIYVDEKIIYCTGYANTPLLFIKKEYVSEYDEDSILLHFSKIQNYWLCENKKLMTVTLHIDRILHDAVMFYGPAFAGIVVSTIIACIFGKSYLYYIVAPVIVSFILLFYIILKRKRVATINRYKTEHPQDKLANALTFDAFKFDW